MELCDYREAQGTYDAVVSVEMVEAVGVEFWPVYFRTLDERLAPGGRAALQAITMPHDRMLASRGTFTWIHKYIFPGGQLPSVEAIEETVRDRTGLRTARRDGFGAHYAETLQLWRERFTERADEVAELGFDDTFRRMWTFYLAYSEAGFRAGYLDVQQYLFTKDGHRGVRRPFPGRVVVDGERVRVGRLRREPRTGRGRGALRHGGHLRRRPAHGSAPDR